MLDGGAAGGHDRADTWGRDCGNRSGCHGRRAAGVTVEASSAVLIEKIRTAVSDGAGRYSVVNLPPGSYTVTFTLTGFTTFRREGIILEGTFTAQVNAEMRVGAVNETITVAGQTPVVDVQNTNRQFVAGQALLDELPGARSLAGKATLIPGYTSASFGSRSTVPRRATSTSTTTGCVEGRPSAPATSTLVGR